MVEETLKPPVATLEASLLLCHKKTILGRNWLKTAGFRVRAPKGSYLIFKAVGGGSDVSRLLNGFRKWRLFNNITSSVREKLKLIITLNLFGQAWRRLNNCKEIIFKRLSLSYICFDDWQIEYTNKNHNKMSNISVLRKNHLLKSHLLI